MFIYLLMQMFNTKIANVSAMYDLSQQVNALTSSTIYYKNVHFPGLILFRMDKKRVPCF